MIKRGSFFFFEGDRFELAGKFVISVSWSSHKYAVVQPEVFQGRGCLKFIAKRLLFCERKIIVYPVFFFLIKFDDWGGFTRPLSLHWAISCTSRLHTIYLENFYAIASNLSINNYNKRSSRFSIACVTKLSIPQFTSLLRNFICVLAAVNIQHIQRIERLLLNQNFWHAAVCPRKCFEL